VFKHKQIDVLMGKLQFEHPRVFQTSVHRHCGGLFVFEKMQPITGAKDKDNAQE
tara:strand:+ start:148 stop:309 length:162 start_codon:yes stop_codon:yes gene_type:complete